MDNRKARLRRKALARGAAEKLARSAIDYDPKTGRQETVDHPAAQAALARAFERLIIEDEPQVLRISIEAAKAFPGEKPADAGPELKAWLGVGVDQKGHATYRLRMFGAPGLSPMQERRAAETIVLAELERETQRPGFPTLQMGAEK